MDPATMYAGSMVLGGALGFMGSERTNAANARIAAENRDWQEYMSNTAHIREAADLRGAGLNPILSVSKGGPGASTPAGNVATMQDSISRGVSSAFEARNQQRADEIGREVVQQEKSNTRIQNAEAHSAEDRRMITANELFKSNVENNAYRLDASGLGRKLSDALHAEAVARRDAARITGYDAFAASLDNKIDQKYGETERMIRRGAGTIGAVTDAVKPWGRIQSGAASAQGTLRGVDAARRIEPRLNASPQLQPKLRPGERLDRETGEIIQPFKARPRR